MIQFKQHPEATAAGKSRVGILLGVVLGVLCVIAGMALLTRESREGKPAPLTDANTPIGSGAGPEVSPQEWLRRRLAEESAATESFQKARNEYRENHQASMASARARRSDAFKAELLAAGSRRERSAMELSNWIWSYPESASVAERMEGDSRLPVVTDALMSWYFGLEDRIDTLTDAECALAAVSSPGSNQALSPPSMLELAKSKSELREPTASRISTHFGFDRETAARLAGQLRPRWRAATDKITKGIARIEQSRRTSPSDSEKEQLLTSGEIRLIRAIDGDTIEVLVRDRFSNVEFTERVRLLNVDTPEIGAPGAGEATSRTGRECAGDLTLEFERPGQVTRDRYGRVLAFVFSDRTFVNAELIKRGHSKFYTEYGEGRYAQYFRFLESRAMRDGSR